MTSPTIEQNAAIKAMVAFIIKGGSGRFLLSGYAGTGKTFCVKEVVREVYEDHALWKDPPRFAFTAPTNKAVKVLRESLGDLPVPTGKKYCRTIYSLLGLRLDATGEVKELIHPDEPVDLSSLTAVIVDEGSMVNKMLLALCDKASAESGVPFIFMGDPAQLPPVKETASGLWAVDDPGGSPLRAANLFKVMRHDNSILKQATLIRERVAQPFGGQIVLLNEVDGEKGEGVIKLKHDDFMRVAAGRAKEGKFTSGESKMIAWRNQTVDKLNAAIRLQIMGITPLPFEIGDRLVACAPCYAPEDHKQQVALMHTDDEGEIVRLAEAVHPYYKHLKCLAIVLRVDGGGGEVALTAIHPDSRDEWKRECNRMANDAKVKTVPWKSFWALKEAFHDLRLAYAITAHRSQGSTYDEVFVDFRDILWNPNRVEAMKCLYVACSRPRKRLYLDAG